MRPYKHKQYIHIRKGGMNTTLSNKKGFTIIEVVLVLAIAGLIFLIVFLALPALQRSQRDTQRRQDASRMLSQLEAYAGNRQGNYPNSQTATNKFVEDYMTVNGQSFADPLQGDNYAVTFKRFSGGTYNAPADAGKMDYIVNAACADGTGTSIIRTGGGDRSIAVVTFLEQGGSYCQDNQ